MGGNWSVPIIETPTDANADANKVEELKRRIAMLEGELKKEREDKARLIRDHEGALQRCRDVIAADHASLRHARARLLMHLRLGSVPTIEPGSFTSFEGAGVLPHHDFPFANLVPGRLHDGTLVLRIQLQPAFQADENVVLRFKETMAIMQALQGGSGSLLRIVGASHLQSNDPIAYVEYVTGMTLQRYLSSEVDAPWPQKLHIAVQVATAIAHMHNLSVMHRNLSWLCVYVDATGRVKVFPGLKMRDTELSRYLTNNVTEARWSAPETLATTESNEHGASYDDKIDIFGLGLLLIAFVTRDLPFMHFRTPKGKSLDDDLLSRWLQDPKLAQELLTSDFGHCPSEEYKALAFSCIQWDPERRPTAPEVVRRLEAMLQTYSGPMNVPTSDATVDLTVVVHKTLEMTFEPTFGSSYALECFVSVDDASRKPVKLSSKVEAATSHTFDQEARIENVDPVDWTLQLIFKSGARIRGRCVGKATIPLVEFLNTEKNDPRSLSAPRAKLCNIYGGTNGETIGKVVISAAFGGQLRERLEDYEARIIKARDAPAEVHRKRNLVAQALLRDAP